jgi:hypothetical protein
MDGKMKRGQVTIFIVLGIIIVAGIFAAVFLRQDLLSIFGKNVEPKSQIQDCVGEALEPSMNLVLENAGDLEPILTKMYNGSKYNYLCYQANDYIPCINTHPMIKTTVEDSLIEDTYDDVEQCFTKLRDDLENRGYTIKEGDLTYSIELVPGNVKVNIQKKLDIKKEDSSQSFEDFSFEILSQMYGLFNMAREVVNQESQYCSFDYNGFMMLYPEYRITRVNYDNSLIYTAINEKSNEKIKFAIRSCTFPAGM